MTKTLKFIDSFAVFNGEIQRIEFHQKRIDETQKHFWPSAKSIEKIDLVSLDLPKQKDTILKGRLVYGYRQYELTFSRYVVRPVETLKIIPHSPISYPFKFHERSELDTAFNSRESGDDILFCIEGKICDSYYGNILFSKNGKEWVTPASYLLNGTMRQYLLSTGRIKLAEITLENIRDYKHWKLINGVMGLDGPEGLMSNVIP